MEVCAYRYIDIDIDVEIAIEIHIGSIGLTRDISIYIKRFREVLRRRVAILLGQGTYIMVYTYMYIYTYNIYIERERGGER